MMTTSIAVTEKDKTRPPIKPGRSNGKNSEHRSGGFIPKRLNNEIELILQKHKDKAAHKDKKVGQGTQDKRRAAIKGFFADLIRLRNPRYPIQSIYNLKQKHLTAVFSNLEAQGQSPSTIQNKISIMRVFCDWIGKYGMVHDSVEYVKDPSSVRRTMVAQEDKSWDGNGIDVLAKIDEVARKDPFVAIQLEQCLAFGLRVRESIMFRAALEGGYGMVSVRDGTKGDRPRVVPIENEVQRDVLRRAKLLADKKTGFVGERGQDLLPKEPAFLHRHGERRSHS